MHWAFLAPELSATSSIVRGWIMAVGSASRGHARQDLPDAPALVLRERPSLFDQHPVAHLARIGLAHVGLLLLARALQGAFAQDSLGPREVPLGLLYSLIIRCHAHRELEPE